MITQGKITTRNEDIVDFEGNLVLFTIDSLAEDITYSLVDSSGNK